MTKPKWTITGDDTVLDVACQHSVENVTLELNQFSDHPVCLELYDPGTGWVNQGISERLWFSPEEARRFAQQLLDIVARLRPAPGEQG